VVLRNYTDSKGGNIGKTQNGIHGQNAEKRVTDDREYSATETTCEVAMKAARSSWSRGN